MQNDEIEQQLLALPEEIASHGVERLRLEWQVESAKESYARAEANLILSGAIDGKNSETRAAQMTVALTDHREVLLQSERDLKVCKLRCEEVQNRFSAIRAVARLRAKNGDE